MPARSFRTTRSQLSACALDARRVEVVERQLARRFLSGGFRGLAMAADAVAIEQRALSRAA